MKSRAIKSVLILCMCVVLCAAFCVVSGAAGVTFSDDNLKNAIIAAGVDSDSDNEISAEEASKCQSLDLSSVGVASLDGLESFTKLISLMDLRINSKYAFTVRGFRRAGGMTCVGSHSSKFYTWTGPAAPTGSVTAGTKSAKLKWNAVPGASRYYIYVYNADTGYYNLSVLDNSDKHYKNGTHKGAGILFPRQGLRCT